METTEGKYFVSNETLIYLKIKGEEKRCGRTILATDVDSIYMLRQYVHFHENQTRIRQKLEPEDIIIALDYTNRDAYIYNKLLDNMKAQVSMMNSKHCDDIRTVKNNLFSSFNNLQLSDAMQPLRIDNKGTYALALSKVIYLFKCKEKLVNPVQLTGSSCYKSLPVTIKESNGQVLFLQARNRMLVPIGVQTICLLNFKAQFKQTYGKYSIYTPEGLVKSSTAYQPLNIHDIQVIGSLERNDVTTPSLYQYDDIIKLNDIISFSTKKSTLLHVLSQDIDIAKASSSSRKNLIDYFKSSTILFEAFKSTFKDFGSYSAGVFTTCALALLGYNFVVHLMGCTLLPNPTKQERLSYFFSPTNCLLKQNKGAFYLNQTEETELREILDKKPAHSIVRST